MTRRARLLGAFFTLGAACTVSGPSTSPSGTYTERIETFASLLAAEDRRVYEPLLTQRAASSPDAWLRARAALSAGRLRAPEAGPILVVLAKDSEAAVRRAAVFGIGLSGDPRLLRFAREALGDGDPEVAELAAEALGKLGGEEASAALLAASSAPASERERPTHGAPAAAITKAPGGAGGAARAAAVTKAPGGAGGAARAAALALFRMPSPAVVQRLAPLASGSDIALRKAAIYALARRPLPEAAPALLRALDDEDPWIVALAARGLGVLAAKEAEARLAALAGSGGACPSGGPSEPTDPPCPSVAIQALLALEKLGARGELSAESRSAALARSGDPAPGIAVAALKTLGRFRNDAQVSERLEAVAAGGGWRGQNALVSLAAVSPERALPRLHAALGPPAGPLEARLAAAESLSVLPAEVGLDLARAALADPSARVRALALASLPKPLLTLHPELAIAALSDADAAVAGAALEVAAPLLAPGTELEKAWTTAFQRALGETEPDVLVTALDAAASRPDGGRALVEPHVEHADAVVRAKARRLMIEKHGASPERFLPVPVRARLGRRDYLRAARAASEARMTATVTMRRGGTFELELAISEAPLTVLSFKELADRRYFDGIVFHRVVPDFVVQTGDPRGDGTGGPGWAIRDEINTLRYERGAVGMALSGPDTGGSQWFVTLSPQPHLDGGYTVFGRVTRGLPVADALEQGDAIASLVVRETLLSGKRRGTSLLSGTR